MRVIKNYINGELVLPPQTFEKINPATNEVIAKVARSQSVDVEGAVKAAHEAFKTWSQTSLQERAEVLRKIAIAIEKRKEELADIESRDTGKPVTLATNMDIARAILNFKFFAEQGLEHKTENLKFETSHGYPRLEPVGVAALITPWNLPLYLLTWKLAPALLMGNTVVAKPSELTPSTAFVLSEILHELKIPRGVVNFVHGFGHEMGDALTTHRQVKMISFTGGTVTGQRISQMASKDLKKISLELGGKNATVVFEDCDFASTVKGVTRASYLNQGQICLCGSRLLLQKSIAEKFIAAMKQEIATWPLGDPSLRSTRFGSLISQAHREKIEKYVAIAKQDGGQIVFGGKRPSLPKPFADGAFYEPTLMTQVPAHSAAVREEIFGPVVTVQTFETAAEAIEMANDTTYGLAASVWTQDKNRAVRVAHALDCGTVWINSWLVRDLRLPFGGTKMSGLGREGGRHSMEFFSQAKAVSYEGDFS